MIPSDPGPAPAAPKKRHISDWRFMLRVAALLAKGFAALFALVLLLGIGTYFALPHVVDGDKAKSILVDQLQRALRRPVRIERVILTPQGIKLTKFTIMEPSGETAFIEGDFALFTVKLRPLLEKRLELSNVRLASPRIKVTSDAEGRWSFQDLLSQREAPAGPASPFTPASLAADRTIIEGGRLEVDDVNRGKHHLIEKFNLTLNQFDFENPFAFEVSFDNLNSFGERKIATAVKAEGVMTLAGLNMPQAYIRASKAQIGLDGRVLKGSVSISSFTYAPEVEADLLAPALGSADWEWWFKKPYDFNLPPSRWKGRFVWLEPRKFRVESLEAKAGPFAGRAQGLVDLTGKLPHVSGEVVAEDFPLDQASGYHAPLQRFALHGTARGEAVVSGWPGRWKVAKAHARLTGAKAEFKHWRVANGSADITGRDDFSDLSVSLSGGAIEAFKNPFSDITLSLRLVRKDLRVDYLSVKWADSRANLQGRVVNLPDPRDVWISGTLDKLQWERAQQLVGDVLVVFSTRAAANWNATIQEDDPKRLWLQAWKNNLPRKFPDTIGHISIAKVEHKNFSFDNLDMIWDLRGVTNKLDTASGELRASFGPGRVNDIQAVQESNKFLRIVFLPYIYMHKMTKIAAFSLENAFPKELDFNRIEGQYGARRGLVDTRFTAVDSPQLLAWSAGQADFAREKVDMTILTRLTTYSGRLPEWWLDEKGRAAIGLRVKGDLNSPELEPRLTKIGGEEIESAIAESRSSTGKRFEAVDKVAQLEKENKGKKK